MGALGMIELNSIPVGIEAADTMMKTAEVDLAAAQTVCAGKYFSVVTGEVDAVKASVDAGTEASRDKLVDSLVIANVHDDVAGAINACTDVINVKALGVIETFSLCAAVLCADTAVKAAEIRLIEVRLGRGLGGKSFVILTGDVAAVKAAVDAAVSLDEVQGLISESVVIPSPQEDLVQSVL